MLPDIWSNASAREPEFSNCVLGKSVVSEMKHRKMVNTDTETLQQTLYYQGIQYKKSLSVHTGISKTFRKTPVAQTLCDQDKIIMISSVIFISSGEEKGKEGRQIYQACITTWVSSSSVSQRTDTTDRLILDYFPRTAKCFRITCIQGCIQGEKS